MAAVSSNRAQTLACRSTLAVLALAALGILAPASAMAAPAAVDQYIPGVEPDGGGVAGAPGGGDPPPDGGEAAQAGADGGTGAAESGTLAVESGEDRGGTIPGGDYPLTPWLAGIAGILALGLLAKVALPLLRGRGDSVRAR
jgi:hypothetical protein